VASVPQVNFAFQPVLSTRTGLPVGIEAHARPAAGSVHDLLCAAGNGGQLTDADVALASSAVLASAEQPVRLPLYVNILATTAVQPDRLTGFLDVAMRRTGRTAGEITLEITPPFSRVPRAELLAGLKSLRQHGFRLALDAMGDGDLPLALLVDARPDLVKMDPQLLRGIPGEPGALAVVEALARFCNRTGIQLAAVGVETEEQLAAVTRLGASLAQGNLFSSTQRRVSPPEPPAEPGPLVADMLRAAVTLPGSATAEDVRELFAGREDINGIVLVDDGGRPLASLDRSRFLLAVTGPYGHALHARRPAIRHADPPRVISWDATALQLLELVGDTAWQRGGDDVVVIDEHWRCLGVVRLTEVVRCVAEAKVEQAAALNPLTRLPGTDTVAREIDRRIARDEMFVVAWLDIDSFKTVNDTAGFAAGDDLIREIGRELTDAEASMPGTLVGHVGGDDFLAVTDIDEIAPLADRLVDRLWTVEGLSVSVSLATLVCGLDTVRSYRDASKLLAPLKKQAKAVPGSSWVLGRPDTDRVDVLRGRARAVS
jgi:diguanylate cyclase (GGDEF)-like protein